MCYVTEINLFCPFLDSGGRMINSAVNFYSFWSLLEVIYHLGTIKKNDTCYDIDVCLIDL